MIQASIFDYMPQVSAYDCLNQTEFYPGNNQLGRNGHSESAKQRKIGTNDMEKTQKYLYNIKVSLHESKSALFVA